MKMKKVKQWLIAVIMSVTVLVAASGCTSLNPLDILTDKPSIEANLNTGENVSQEKSTIKVETDTTNQTADKISNDTNAEVINQITQNVPMEYLAILILMAGWLIPSPKECYSGAKWLFKDLFNSLIKTPIKGICDFILLLSGRERL